MTFESDLHNQREKEGANDDSPHSRLLEDIGLPRLQLTSLVDKSSTQSATEAFCAGLADGAYRQPLKAVEQLLGKKDVLEPTPPASKDSFSANSQSHQVGQIIGSLVPFALLGLATRGVSNSMFGAEAAPTLWRTVGEQAATGFVLGSVLTPSELKPNESLFSSRMQQGGLSALTFAAMGGSAHMLDRALPQFGAGSISLASRRLTIAALSGASGGAVDAEMRSGFKASGKDVLSSSLGYAAFGVAMEGGGMLSKAMLNNVTGTPESIPQANDVTNSIEDGRRDAGRGDAADNLPSEDGANQDLPPQLKGFKEFLADVTGGDKNAADSLKQARIARIFAAVDNAEVPESKIEKPTQVYEKGWEPDPRLTLVPKEDLPYAREVVLDELKSFEGGGEAHRFQLDKELMNTPYLSDAQKVRLTDAVVQVRDYYANLNTEDNPQAFKAQRSWALSQASLADVLNDTIVNAEKGVKPDSAELENNLLLRLFSQFRIHDENSSELDIPKLNADREAGAKTILANIGYPKEQILHITDALYKQPLYAQSMDLVKYNEDVLKGFEPNYKTGLVQRDSLLESKSPIQEEWKIPSGEVTKTDAGQLSKWSSEKGNGELVRHADGTSAVSDLANDRHFTYAADGKITEAAHVDNRQFFYSESGELHRIESDDLGHLYRSKNGSWYKDLGFDKNGSPGVEHFWKGQIVADDNGSIRMIKPDTSAVRIYSIDGSETLNPEIGRAELKSANYDYEKAVLSDRIKATFPEPVRQERMSGLVESFEKQGSDRGLSDNSKALFYRQLNRLLSDDELKLPVESRRDLAEQATNHGAFPTSIDQGGNPTCNVTTIENRIYTRSPQDIAGMLADLAESGEYTTHSGATIDVEHSLTGFKPDAEARESLRLQAEGKSDVKIDGHRDWASQLAQTVMAKIKHLQTTEFIAKDTVMDDNDLAFDKNANFIGKVSAAEIAEPLDARGKKIEVLTAGQDVYRKVGERLERVSPDSLVYDKHGELNGSVSDRAKISTLYDYFGKPSTKLEPGTNYFDKDGNLAMFQTLPGDITYDKLTSSKPDKPSVPFDPSGDASRLNARHLGADIFLKQNVDGKESFIDSPLLNVNYYRDIANEVDGVEKSPFSLARGAEYKTYRSSIRISNEAELEAEIVKMQDADNLPGILRVHTRHWPFNHKVGGWHVVNLQGYDPETKMVEFSNQWGSKHDHMGDNAVPLAKLFEAMQEPKDPPPPAKEAPKPPVPIPPPQIATSGSGIINVGSRAQVHAS